jgi:very-short-patch-repair endonuclease
MPLSFSLILVDKNSMFQSRRRYRYNDPEKLEKATEMRKNPTPAEAKMYNILYASVVPRFPEHKFYRQSVKFGYILDFYCPTLHLGIEVDGGIHDEQVRYDTHRDNILAKHGIHVFRFSNDDVLYNSQAVAFDICQLAETRANHRGFLATTHCPPSSI